MPERFLLSLAICIGSIRLVSILCFRWHHGCSGSPETHQQERKCSKVAWERLSVAIFMMRWFQAHPGCGSQSLALKQYLCERLSSFLLEGLGLYEGFCSCNIPAIPTSSGLPASRQRKAGMEVSRPSALTVAKRPTLQKTNLEPEKGPLMSTVLFEGPLSRLHVRF